MIGYGSVDRPFNEAFGRIIEVHWGKALKLDFPAAPSIPVLVGTNPDGLRSKGSWCTWISDSGLGAASDGFFDFGNDASSGGFAAELRQGKINPTFDPPFQTGFGIFPWGAWIDDSGEFNWTIRPSDSIVITNVVPFDDGDYNYRADQRDMDYGVWHNVLMSWDVAGGRKTIVIDDQVKDVVYEPVPFTGQDNGAVQDDSGAIPSRAPSIGLVDGRGARFDWWLTSEYIDFSVEANRRRFISADKKPVPLGADGAKGSPTNRQPEFFFHPGNDLASFSRNRGSGGDVAWMLDEVATDPIWSIVARPTAAGS